MIRRPPRSTLDRSSAASDVYKRQNINSMVERVFLSEVKIPNEKSVYELIKTEHAHLAVSYTHLRAHETVLDLVCRLLLEKKKSKLHNYTPLII